MNRALVLSLLLTTACECQPPGAPPASGPAALEVPSPPAVPFSAASFPCCAVDSVRVLVVGNDQLAEALAQDDLEVARVELEEVARRAAMAAEDPALSESSRVQAAAIAEQARGRAPERLETLRALFKEISERLIVLVQANRGGSMRVAVAFCPRSNANWLQAGPGIMNPYLGSLEASSGVFRP
ncbi:MAG: hypothetical protein ABIO70_16655 [Pseudomonadota bacterium]